MSAYFFVGQTVAPSNGTFVTPLLGPNGTAALPTYSFSSDPDTGMYRVAANTLGWSTNGVLAMSLNSAALLNVVGAITAGGVFTGVAGAVGAPGINLGEANTGIYSAATHQLNLATNGTLGFTLASDQTATFASTITGTRVIVNANAAATPGVAVGTGAGLWSSGSNTLNIALNSADVVAVDVLSTNCRFFNKIASGSTNGFTWYNGAGNQIWTIDGTNGGILKSRDGLTLQVEGGTNGAKCLFTTVNGTATAMSGATATISNIIPAGSIVVGVSLRVTTLITSAVGTSFTIGDGTTAAAFGSLIAFAAGTTTSTANWTVTGAPIYTAATSIVLTCTGGTFTAGAVRCAVTYINAAAPTS